MPRIRCNFCDARAEVAADGWRQEFPAMACFEQNQQNKEYGASIVGRTTTEYFLHILLCGLLVKMIER